MDIKYPKVFISYRRDDAEGYPFAIRELLAYLIGLDNVFLDVANSIPPGEEWKEVIIKNIIESDIILVLMGKRWLEAKDKYERRRIDISDDMVVLEIDTAIKNFKRIVPVLIDTNMPPKEALPDNLKKLCDFQGMKINQSSFYSDTNSLFEQLDILSFTPVIQRIITEEVENNSNVSTAHVISCKYCNFPREIDLSLSCPNCGAKKYTFGYFHPPKARIMRLLPWIKK